MPGASTPPANSPAALTTSKFVDVPKSTTTAGAPCRSRAATAFAIRSGPHLARIVVADRHPGRDARAEHEQLGAGPALGERLVLAHEQRHRRAEDDPVERLQVDERPQQHRELVAGVGAVGADAELLGQRRAVEQAEDGLRVPDVDREQHGARVSDTEGV